MTRCHSMTRADLTAKLFSPETPWVDVQDHKGTWHRGVLQSVERESGDGRSFNVRIVGLDRKHLTVFVRTVD